MAAGHEHEGRYKYKYRTSDTERQPLFEPEGLRDFPDCVKLFYVGDIAGVVLALERTKLIKKETELEGQVHEVQARDEMLRHEEVIVREFVTNESLKKIWGESLAKYPDLNRAIELSKKSKESSLSTEQQLELKGLEEKIASIKPPVINGMSYCPNHVIKTTLDNVLRWETRRDPSKRDCSVVTPDGNVFVLKEGRVVLANVQPKSPDSEYVLVRFNHNEERIPVKGDVAGIIDLALTQSSGNPHIQLEFASKPIAKRRVGKVGELGIIPSMGETECQLKPNGCLRYVPAEGITRKAMPLGDDEGTVLVQHNNCVVLHNNSELKPGDSRFVLCSFEDPTGMRCSEVKDLDAIERQVSQLTREGKGGTFLIFNFEQRPIQPEPKKTAPAAAAAPPSYLDATTRGPVFPPDGPRFG